MGYLKWDVKQIDEFVELMFDPDGFVFPPTLWNPAAGVLVTMYKNLAEGVLPEVHVNLSMTPEVVRKRYLEAENNPTEAWTESVLDKDGPGTIHLFGCGPVLVSDTAENKEKLEKQMRSVITEGAEFGQWYEIAIDGSKENMLTFEQVATLSCEDAVPEYAHLEMTLINDLGDEEDSERLNILIPSSKIESFSIKKAWELAVEQLKELAAENDSDVYETVCDYGIELDGDRLKMLGAVAEDQSSAVKVTRRSHDKQYLSELLAEYGEE